MSGAGVPEAVRQRVRETAGERCGYCLSPQRLVMGQLEVEHLVPLYNPRTNNWHEHFNWSAEGAKIIGRTATGRATVVALKLNNEVAVEARRNWILAGWHPPKS